MLPAIISLILFLILVLIAVRIGFNKEKTEEESFDPIIHASGIYSIVRKNPRENLDCHKPSLEEIRKYFSEQNESKGKYLFSVQEQSQLIENWNESLSNNIDVIERGDKEGVEFYYFGFQSENACPGCKKYLSKGQFVTREEIYRYPELIPPFHIGCTCVLHPHHGKENLKETTELGMLPFFKQDSLPALPDWRIVNKPDALRGTTA